MGGNSIVYIELNPCKCCPDTALKVTKFSDRRRAVSTTLIFKDPAKDLVIYLRMLGLLHLKPRDVLTEKESEFWEEFNRNKSYKMFKKSNKK